MTRIAFVAAVLTALFHASAAFSPATRNIVHARHQSVWKPVASSTTLRMSSEMQRDTSKKEGTSVITKDRDETETDMEEDIDKEEMWRVILHNDEVHTFNYVISSLIKVIGTIDKKKAHDICVLTHGQGQAVVKTGCYKPQAMKYCVGMQRAGLTASIAPEGNVSHIFNSSYFNLQSCFHRHINLNSTSCGCLLYSLKAEIHHPRQLKS
jgi:ATP-dependent Clp protease adapter protein ClpS